MMACPVFNGPTLENLSKFVYSLKWFSRIFYGLTYFKNFKHKATIFVDTSNLIPLAYLLKSQGLFFRMSKYGYTRYFKVIILMDDVQRSGIILST